SGASCVIRSTPPRRAAARMPLTLAEMSRTAPSSPVGWWDPRRGAAPPPDVLATSGDGREDRGTTAGGGEDEYRVVHVPGPRAGPARGGGRRPPADGVEARRPGGARAVPVRGVDPRPRHRPPGPQRRGDAAAGHLGRDRGADPVLRLAGGPRAR